MKFNTIEELLNYTEAIKGKTFKEFDEDDILGDRTSLVGGRGDLGKLVETGFYKYPNNNISKADFDNIGVELKVTGYKKNKNGTISAKERVSLNQINFNEIVEEDYEGSHLISKNQKILFIWYVYEKGKMVKDFVITHYQLFDMDTDKEIFKNDFYTIQEKVLKGHAEDLSEGDTTYLGACRKGADGSSTTTQPNSDVLAPTRAFSLKQKYMTWILRDGFEDHKQTTLTFETRYKTAEDYIYDKIEPYLGQTQVEIYEKLTGVTFERGKIVRYDINKQIANILIGKDEELEEKNDLFKKSSFIIKNLPLLCTGYPKERMTFRTMSKEDFVDDWEDSDWKKYFEETTLLVICYKQPTKEKTKNGYRVLDGVKRISFNDDDLESIEKSYNMIKETIEKEDLNLLPNPKSFDGQIIEIAPKRSKGKNTYDLFLEKDKVISFALTKEFLNEKLYL